MSNSKQQKLDRLIFLSVDLSNVYHICNKNNHNKKKFLRGRVAVTLVVISRDLPTESRLAGSDSSGNDWGKIWSRMSPRRSDRIVTVKIGLNLEMCAGPGLRFQLSAFMHQTPPSPRKHHIIVLCWPIKSAGLSGRQCSMDQRHGQLQNLCCPDLMPLTSGYVAEYWKYYGWIRLPTRKLVLQRTRTGRETVRQFKTRKW